MMFRCSNELLRIKVQCELSPFSRWRMESYFTVLVVLPTFFSALSDRYYNNACLLLYLLEPIFPNLRRWNKKIEWPCVRICTCFDGIMKLLFIIVFFSELAAFRLSIILEGPRFITSKCLGSESSCCCMAEKFFAVFIFALVWGLEEQFWLQRPKYVVTIHNTFNTYDVVRRCYVIRCYCLGFGRFLRKIFHAVSLTMFTASLGLPVDCVLA